MTKIPKPPEILREWEQVLGKDFDKHRNILSPFICLSHLSTLPERSCNENDQLATENTTESPSTSNTHENDSISETTSIPCNARIDHQVMFTQCSNCHCSVNQLTPETKFLNILSCGHVLCDTCLSAASIYFICNSFPYNTCPICGTMESFMTHPTIHNNVAHCALHKDKQAKVYCRECMQFSCSEKECEEHYVIKIEDIDSENDKLRDNIDVFQSSVNQLMKMELAARTTLSKFDRKSDEVRNRFQFIIDTATERMNDVQKTIQLERIILAKKVENISKNVKAVNRRIQAASQLDEVIRNSFPTPEKLQGQTYKLVAGSILQKAIGISKNVKSTSQQLQNYHFFFENDNRVHVIVKHLRTLFTNYTVSNLKDFEVPSQKSSELWPISRRQIINFERPKWYPQSRWYPPRSSMSYIPKIQISANRISSSNDANKLTPEAVTSQSEKRPNVDVSSLNSSMMCPQKTQPQSEVKTNDIESTPNRRKFPNKTPEKYQSLEPEKKKMMMECSSCSKDNEVPSQMSSSDQIPLSKNAEILTPISQRQTIIPNTEKPIWYPSQRSELCPAPKIKEKKMKGRRSNTIVLRRKRKPNQIIFRSFEPEKGMKMMECLPSYKIHKTPSQMNSSDQNPSSSNTPIPLPQSITPNTERPTSTLYPQNIHSLTNSEKKIEGPVPKITSPHCRKAQNEIEYRFLKSGEKIQILEPLCWMSSSHEYSNVIVVCKKETCKHESRNKDEEENVEKMCGKDGTAIGGQQRVHRNPVHSEQDQEEFQNAKEEMIEIEPLYILDKQIKKEEPA